MNILDVFLVYIIIIIIIIVVVIVTTFMQVIYKQTTFLEYIVTALYLNLCYIECYFANEIGFVLFVLRVQYPKWLRL